MTIALDYIGDGLNRPECALAHRSGLVLVPDWTPPGGVTAIVGAHSHRLLATQPGEGVDLPVRANGIALEDGGSLLLAHLGETRGGIYRLHADGRCEVVVDRVEGAPMPPANFVAKDSQGRLWITVSTTRVPRALDYRPDAASGFIALAEPGAREARVVAGGLGYANECLLSEDETTLWVNETFARRLTAFDVGEGLSNRRPLTRFGPGTFPDGLAETVDGSLFVTSIVSNRVLRLYPDGRLEIVLEDADPTHLAHVELAFQANEMGRPHLDTPHAGRLANISNLAFAGPALDEAILGCLLGTRLARFKSPVPGRALPHWDCDLGPLATLLECL
ncbi:MAG: SMP-30/gluconolactonase/LRE family protein [Pseudomonadota bacterium]